MTFLSYISSVIRKISSGIPSLARIFFVYPMLVATITSLSLALYFTISEFNRYKAGNELLKIEFPVNQRRELKYKIVQAKDYIHFVRTHPATNINKYLNKRLTEAGTLLKEGIDSTDKNNYKLKPSAKDSLDKLFVNSALQLAITGPGKFPVYIYNSLGNEGGQNERKDPIMEASGKGNLYHALQGWMVVQRVHPDKPVVFSTKSGVAGISILAQFYPRDSVKLLQEQVLDSLSKVRFDNGEYIFINTFDGKGLITKGTWHRVPLDILKGSDSNWKAIFIKELEFSQKSSGDFLSYNWSKNEKTGYTQKVSYISGLEDWKWIIGSGVHAIDIEPLLTKRKDDLKAGMKAEFIKFILFLVLLYAVIYFITRVISNMTSSNIRLFVNFLRNAAKSMQSIDESKVHFREFQTLAKAANQMISERDRIKSVLAVEQSRLNYIIDAIPDLVFFKDTESRFLGCNKAFENYIGKSAAKIIGLSEYELFTNTNADTYIASDKRLLTTLEPNRNTEWITYPDGHKILCDTLKTLYFDQEGNVLGIIGISRDITEMEETRQRLIMAKEKAEESDRLKTAFLANMSHEIRTPMNAIIGFSDLLADEGILAEEKADFISKIKLSGESLMNIINDIIDIAKIESGQLSISDSECNVDELLADIYGTFFEIKNKNNKTDLELKLTYPGKNSPLYMITDPLRLQQVLSNLLSNALKFTEFGEVEFGYTIRTNDIHFFVKDSGIGILRSKQQLLFQRFSQLDTSTTRKYGGTGLGLAISKNIVELMGGTIWLESEPGQGSVFHFSIPYRKPHHSPEQQQNIDTTFNWKGKTILIAEDVEQNYILMEAVLRFTQVTLLHAPNGQKAIDMAIEIPGINLVLMDIQLPVKTGYEAIHEIRLIKPELPIISFTAYALPREREKSLEAGCVDFMNKPIKPDRLLSVIRKYI